jgi:hypothetical protein
VNLQPGSQIGRGGGLQAQPDRAPGRRTRFALLPPEPRGRLREDIGAFRKGSSMVKYLVVLGEPALALAGPACCARESGHLEMRPLETVK